MTHNIMFLYLVADNNQPSPTSGTKWKPASFNENSSADAIPLLKETPKHTDRDSGKRFDLSEQTCQE